jgi:ATP-binding cassette, subfamily B, multidrug efflux pump
MKTHRFSKNLFWEMTFAKKWYFFAAICASLLGALLAIFATYLQKLVVDGLAVQVFLPSKELLGIFLFTLLSQSLSFFSRYLCLRQATAYFSTLSLRLYKHTLALMPRSRGKHSVGELVSFYTQDMSATVAYLEEFLPSIVMSVIPLLCVPFAAQYLHNVPLWGPFAVMGISISLCFFLSYRQAVFFGISKKLAERRLGIVNEWVQNIKIIRSLNIDFSILKRIQSVRKHETHNRRLTVTNGSTMNAIAQISPLCINISGLILFVKTSTNALTPGDILGIFWLYGVLCARPLRSLPWALVTFLDANTSRKRLETYFSLTIDETIPLQKNSSFSLDLHSTSKTLLPLRPALKIEKLNLEIDSKPILNNVSFIAHTGDFICIVGNVGSGKTSFLNALLFETEASFATYEIFGVNTKQLSSHEVRSFFGLVPQSSFVMNSSLRDNVAFEYETKAEKNAKILESLALSAFVPSQEWMESGLDTEIGERGVNLSGGQKQRVSLARLHHHERDILLMDDTLSALDPNTETEIQQKLLLGNWKLKTKILVTHRHSILPYATRIYFFSHGKIAAVGTYEELMAQSEDFSDFILKKQAELKTQ